MKIAIIEGLALALEQASIQLLPDEAGKAELEAYEMKTDDWGKRKYSAPVGMHDDTVIARALMYRLMSSGMGRKRRSMSDAMVMSLTRRLNTR